MFSLNRLYFQVTGLMAQTHIWGLKFMVLNDVKLDYHCLTVLQNQY